MAINSSLEDVRNAIQVKEGLWCFPVRSGFSGNTSWWLNCEPEPVLIDCPEVTEDVLKDLDTLSAGKRPLIVLTSRYSHHTVKELEVLLGWDVLLQEQESYLLPGLQNKQTFSEKFRTQSGLELLWTPGPTPGSCVAYIPSPWNVLFCGRLLIEVSFGEISPFKAKKTFHWNMQLKSLQKMRLWCPSKVLPEIASGVILSSDPSQILLPWKGLMD